MRIAQAYFQPQVWRIPSIWCAAHAKLSDVANSEMLEKEAPPSSPRAGWRRDWDSERALHGHETKCLSNSASCFMPETNCVRSQLSVPQAREHVKKIGDEKDAIAGKL